MEEVIRYIELTCTCGGRLFVLGANPNDLVCKCEKCGEVLVDAFDHISEFAAEHMTVVPKGNGKTKDKPLKVKTPKKKPN